MGKGKKWTQEELKHLAEAWISISEDAGESALKGTNQDADEFWNRIYNVYIGKAPDAAEGYGNRALSAVKSQWKDKLSKYVRAFNKKLQKVQRSNPTGCTEQNIINMAVAIQMGRVSAMSYLHKESQPMDWPYYSSWLILKDHRAFLPPAPPPVDAFVEEIDDEEDGESGGRDDISAITNGTTPGKVPSVAGLVSTVSTAKPKGSNSRGPGHGSKKSKQLAAQEEYKKKRAKCHEDLIVIQRKKQASFDVFALLNRPQNN